jgi:hypothetical protein
MGNDTPEPLYDEELLHNGREKISLLMAGVGDARHLFMKLTIVSTTDFLSNVLRILLIRYNEFR